MSAQHTPGPWKHDTLGGTTVWSSKGKSAVAVCQGFERADNIANARLIAAAPDLLAALQACYEYLDMIPESATGGDDAAIALARRARAAIAKATS